MSKEKVGFWWEKLMVKKRSIKDTYVAVSVVAHISNGTWFLKNDT